MKTVLIADDEAMAIRILKLSLEDAGYRVETARNGQEALNRLDELEPDALITDIEMPTMSGKELCLHLRTQTPERNFPIFVVTSITAVEHREWSKNLPNVRFLEKPISMRNLLAHLETYFREEQSKTA